jgi:hypothetical protein
MPVSRVKLKPVVFHIGAWMGKESLDVVMVDDLRGA